MESFGFPVITGISSVISKSAQSNREYYDGLESATTGGLRIDRWIAYFLALAEDALDHTQSIFDFVIAKTRFYEQFGNIMNTLQRRPRNPLRVASPHHRKPEPAVAGRIRLNAGWVSVAQDRDQASTQQRFAVVEADAEPGEDGAEGEGARG